MTVTAFGVGAKWLANIWSVVVEPQFRLSISYFAMCKQTVNVNVDLSELTVGLSISWLDATLSRYTWPQIENTPALSSRLASIFLF